MAARRSLTGSINNHERGHRGHDRRLHENIPSPDLNIARNPNPAEAPPCTNSPKSAIQKCCSCHAEAPFPTRLLPFSNSRDPCHNCSPSLFTVGDLQCLQRCFSSCPKNVAVTFGCTYLNSYLYYYIRLLMSLISLFFFALTFGKPLNYFTCEKEDF
jgi:hypothetical protein